MRAFGSALAVLLIAVARPATAIDITACGQNVPDGEVGDLVASLDCTDVGGQCVDDPDTACTRDQDCTSSAKTSLCYTWGVRLGSRASLRLNGFSIVGGAPGSPSGWPRVGVLCRGSDCAVDGGGGSIERTSQAGVWHFGRGSMTVDDVVFREAGIAVLSSYIAKRLFVNDVTVHGGVGIAAGGVDVFLENVNLVHQVLPLCESAPLLSGRRLRGSNVTATYVLAERGINLTGLTVDASPGCSDGVIVQRGPIRLTDSSITGAPHVDLASKGRPHLVNTTCGTSRRLGRGGVVLEDTPWGVCAGD